MKNTVFNDKTIFVNRLGRHHFAHLRSIAEGLDIQDSAKRYLGVEHGHQAVTAHRQTVDSVRSLSRRRGDKAWRLIGLTITFNLNKSQPSLEDFITDRDLDGWTESEITKMYADAYPVDLKSIRRHKLRERQISLLHQLETMAAEIPLLTDMVSGWFDDVTSKKLISAGLVTLNDLNTKIIIGGRWYSTLPGIGISKAKRIKNHLYTLLGHLPILRKNVFELSTKVTMPASLEIVHDALPSPALPISSTQVLQLLSANNDVDAIESWIASRAGSKITATVYRREAMRLLLWLQYECQDKSISQMNINDCGNYMAFLQNIPLKWISRIHASPGAPGWAPFRGQLSRKSQAQSIIIVAALFTWLQSAQYISANPWHLINQKTGDDANEIMLDTKALSESAVIEIIKFIDIQPPSPARSRIRFIIQFVESVGLRSAELLHARLGDFRLEDEGWVMQVYGKGSKNRIIAIPDQALDALLEYLKDRGISSIDSAPPELPLLVSTINSIEPICYQSLYQHVKSWLTKAVSESSLSSKEKSKLSGASTHWLRHTFGTRAVAREVPLDAIQAQMGHTSIQTTTAIYGRAPIRRLVIEIGKAFK